MTGTDTGMTIGVRLPPREGAEVAAAEAAVAAGAEAEAPGPSLSFLLHRQCCLILGSEQLLQGHAISLFLVTAPGHHDG